MQLAIMQPYLFPYLGYFQLMHRADRFVLLDAVQYIRHGWINRNRILKPGEGWQYFILPLQPHHQTDSIAQIQYQPQPNHREKLLRQLEHYKKKAPHYEACRAVVAEALATPELSVTQVNAHALLCCNRYIGIHTPVHISSQLSLQYHEVQHAGQWALRIAQQLQATAYLNPEAGAELFVPEEFAAAGIALQFLQPALPAYSQRRPVFEPGLSIIDVMMCNEPAAIRQMLDACTINNHA